MLGWLQIPEPLRGFFIAAQEPSGTIDTQTSFAALRCLTENPTYGTRHQIGKAFERLGVRPAGQRRNRLPTIEGLFSSGVQLCRKRIPEKDQKSSGTFLDWIVENTDFSDNSPASETASSTKLTPAQSAIFVQSVLMLSHFGLDAMNTGNLQDLVTLTLKSEVGTPEERVLQAFVELWADAFKSLPIADDAPLVPPLILVNDDDREDQLLRTFGEFISATGLTGGDAMVVAHPNLAFGHPEVRELAKELIRATMPRENVERRLNWMIILTQHSASSSYVRDRLGTLSPNLSEFLNGSEFAKDDQPIEAFYRAAGKASSNASQFDLNEFKRLFDRLPPPLQDSMKRDLISSFQEATLNSGKWVYIMVRFEGCTTANQVLSGIARVANQYCEDWICLGGTRETFREQVRDPLSEYLGIRYDEASQRFALPDDALIPDRITEQMHLAQGERLSAS